MFSQKDSKYAKLSQQASDWTKNSSSQRSDTENANHWSTRELISAQKMSHEHNKDQSPTVTLTWHTSKYKMYKLHQRTPGIQVNIRYINSTRGQLHPLVEFMCLVFTHLCLYARAEDV